MVEVPKEVGIPEDHVALDNALPGVPDEYLTLVLFWNTHASQTVFPAETVTGAVSETVCHPAVGLTVAEAVTPNCE